MKRIHKKSKKKGFRVGVIGSGKATPAKKWDVCSLFVRGSNLQRTARGKFLALALCSRNILDALGHCFWHGSQLSSPCLSPEDTRLNQIRKSKMTKVKRTEFKFYNVFCKEHPYGVTWAAINLLRYLRVSQCHTSIFKSQGAIPLCYQSLHSSCLC